MIVNDVFVSSTLDTAQYKGIRGLYEDERVAREHVNVMQHTMNKRGQYLEKGS